jgi:hypothetical protein
MRLLYDRKLVITWPRSVSTMRTNPPVMNESPVF